jgi:uncharacterized protein (TIGR02453 family)
VGFDGFPEQALDFYEDLAADNSKTYWTDHRQVYDECVAGPLRALLDELEPEFGPAKVFRPYRDVRFSKDKTPYKTHAGAVVQAEGSGALYVQLSADGLLVAGGMWAAPTERSRALRAAAADERTGPPLRRALEALRRDGFTVQGEELQRVPKPWDAEHPRADLLRRKTLTASRHDAPEPWLHTRAALDRVAGGWRALAPLNRWLERHVLAA